jgi:hypothetical protein
VSATVTSSGAFNPLKEDDLRREKNGEFSEEEYRITNRAVEETKADEEVSRLVDRCPSRRERKS